MRLLILAPHFPPTNAADAQRVRMYLPYLQALGWHITVLAVDPRDVAAPHDDSLCRRLPAEVRVIRVRTISLRMGRWLGSSSLSWRALGALRRAGDALLRREAFDVLYVSTTQFGLARLAWRWLKQWGLRYVFDLQDPWISDHHVRHPHEPPPGGRLKFALAQAAARRWEPRVLGAAAAITVVSRGYATQLLQRYPTLDPARVLHLPFGIEPADVETPQDPRSVLPFDPADGHEHWVYVGRGGADLAPALTPLFVALADWQQRDPRAAARIRLHFIGTSYAPAAQAVATLAPLAAAAGIAALVREYPARVPYAQALHCLHAAHALLLPTSSDAAYQPSKLHLCLAMRRPLLALFAHHGALAEELAQVPGVVVVRADGGASGSDAVTSMAHTIRRTWLEDVAARRRIPDAGAWLAPHTASAAAHRLHAVLASVASAGPPSPRPE